MRTVLLLLITAAASAPDTADGADCEPSAEVVDDLQFAIDTSEQSETESVVATISPLSWWTVARRGHL
jgi:hypothetical protein